MTTLYHGTTKQFAKAIRNSGIINGPAFFTPRFDVAAEYAGDDENVICVDVDEEMLLIDLDMPGAALISVAEANAVTGNNWTISEYLNAGYSVGCQANVAI